MSPSKEAYYSHLPNSHHQHQNDVVVWPLSIIFNHCRNSFRQRYIIWAVGLAIFLGAVYVCWPSDPELKIVRLRLKRIKVHTVPHLSIDIWMLVSVRVQNTAVYSMDYQSLDVAVGYRGKKLGHVRSDGGHVKAKGSSDVDAKLAFEGINVMSDVVFFLEDLAKGTVPFDTNSEVEGYLGLFFFHFPMEAKLKCQVLINTVNQTIAHQKCMRKD